MPEDPVFPVEGKGSHLFHGRSHSAAWEAFLEGGDQLLAM